MVWFSPFQQRTKTVSIYMYILTWKHIVIMIDDDDYVHLYTTMTVQISFFAKNNTEMTARQPTGYPADCNGQLLSIG